MPVNRRYSTQNDVIEFLSRALAHGKKSPIRRIDTHGAIVFLNAHRAYKLKRAIKFRYMDFSTLPKRLKTSIAEVNLNRRTAPELYLGLMPVLEQDGSLILGKLRQPAAISSAVKRHAREWLIVMKRFADNALYDRIVTRRRLKPGEVEAIAEAVWNFHASASRCSSPAEGRTLDWVVAGNLEEIFRRSPALFRKNDIHKLAARWKSMLGRTRNLLAARRRQGFVRHVHGDLHLRNICAIDGKPILFDALEFDTRLATIDVLYDLAFLLMDLEHRGLHAESNRLLNYYLSLSVAKSKGDLILKGLAALPLFLSSRAAIRAHTEAAAAEMQTNRHEAMFHRAEARRYLGLVQEFLAPPRPMLIAVGGLSGTGKTTLARALAPRVGAAPGAVVLRSDVIRKRLAGKDFLTRLPQSGYTSEMTEEVYKTIAWSAAMALAAGHAVIADAVFAHPKERRDIARVAAKLGVPFVGLWLQAPAATLAKRLTARRFDASDATPAILDRQLHYDLGELSWDRLPASGDPKRIARRAGRLVAAQFPKSIRKFR